jgi:hypothetical protein
MENERDDRSGSKDNSPASEDRARHTMDNQGSEGSFGGQSSGSQSGSADSNGSSIAGGGNGGKEGDGMSGQPIGGNDSNTGTGTTLTQGADFGGQSATGQAQPNDGSGDTRTADQRSSASSRDEGFIGSQSGQSDDYLREKNPSGAAATGGSDFARQGRGALDEEDDESDSGSNPSSS